MQIKGDDFILTPVNDYNFAFDLSLLQTINKGKSNERKEFKIEGYGFRLDMAIKTIIMFKLHNKYNNEVLTLKQFLEEFKNIEKQLKNDYFSNYSIN